ncbi:MAG: inositol monophosphatase family protein [Actinomycetota bacterium]
MSVDTAELLALAAAAADVVGPGLLAPDARNDLGIDTKSSATDMVTAMDRWAEETIVEVLLDARPGDGLLGEEGADKPSETGVVWIIDPIDGTTNFIRDLPGFSVAIAARVDGVDTVGVVHDPVRSERFSAVLGEGAFCNGERLRVSEPVDLARTVLATGFNYRPEVRAEQARLLGELLPDIADIRRFGGAAIDCCSVAAGRLDAYYEVGVHDWDVAAGGLLVREAGGRTLDRRPAGPFVCGSPTIFEDLITRLGLTD